MVDTVTQTTLANFAATLSGLVEDGTRQVIEITDTGTLVGAHTISDSLVNVLIRAESPIAFDLANPTAPHPVFQNGSSFVFSTGTGAAGATCEFEGVEVILDAGSGLPFFDNAALTFKVTRCSVNAPWRGIELKKSGSTYITSNCYYRGFSSYAINGLVGTVSVDKCAFISPTAGLGLYRGASLTVSNSVFFVTDNYHGSGGSLTFNATNLTSGEVTGVTTAAFTDYAGGVYTAAVGGVLDGAGAGGTDIAPDAVVIDTIQITNQVSDKCLQRDSADQHVATISGTYSGGNTPTSIEVRVGGGAWTVLDSAPTGGNYTGTVTLDVGVNDISVRWSNVTTVSTTISSVAVGDVYLCYGQSNHSGRAINAQTFTGPSGYCKKIAYSDGSWLPFTSDPFDSSTSAGSYFPVLANMIVAASSVPVAFIAAAEGSTTTGEWTKPGTLYTRMTNLWNAAAAGGARAALIWLGEGDAAAGTSETTFKTNMNSIVDDVKADFGIDTVMINISGEVSAGYTNVRQWINDIAVTNANALDGPDMWSVFQAIHYTTDQEVIDVSQAVFDTIQPLFYPFYRFTGTLKNWSTGAVIGNETGLKMYVWDAVTGELITSSSFSTDSAGGYSVALPLIAKGASYLVGKVDSSETTLSLNKQVAEV